MMTITIEQARRFMLMKNGLLGPSALRGKDGVLEYVLQAGCVQFDPVDVCGKSHELALLARVKGFSRQMLWELLYEDRALIDYFDKNMCIMLTQDWPSLGYMREHFRTHTRSRTEVEKVAGELMKIIRREGCVSSQELMAILRREQMAEEGVDVNEKVDWPWGATSIARAALETLYFRGDLVIHHKTGTVKSYAIAADCLPHELLSAPIPFQNERERQTGNQAAKAQRVVGARHKGEHGKAAQQRSGQNKAVGLFAAQAVASVKYAQRDVQPRKDKERGVFLGEVAAVHRRAKARKINKLQKPSFADEEAPRHRCKHAEGGKEEQHLHQIHRERGISAAKHLRNHL